jgi:hypothetical protein
MERNSIRNWLERNPKKTLFFLVLVIIGGLTLLTEKLLAVKAGPQINYLGVKRYIQLSAYP